MNDQNKILVAVVCYNRSDHTSKCLNAIRKFFCEEKHKVVIFQDYDNSQSKEWKLTNSIVTAFNFETKLNKQNLGLRENIFSILSFFYNSEYSNIIVIEDDIIITENFFNFFNYAFDKFEDHNDIFQISGFSPLKYKSNFFGKYPRISTWGWGTWKKKFPNPKEIKLDWNNFELTEDLIVKIKEYMPDVFNLIKLKQQGKINAWSLDYLIFMISNNLNTLYPGNSLIENIGFDGSGENCNDTKPFFDIKKPKKLYHKPVNELNIKKIKNVFKSYYSPSLIKKIQNKIIKIT